MYIAITIREINFFISTLTNMVGFYKFLTKTLY